MTRRSWSQLGAALVGFLTSLGFGYGPGMGMTDTDSALRAAWSLVHRGNFAVDYLPALSTQTVRVGGSWYTDRPLGMILLSAPSQLFFAAPSRFGVLVTAALLTGFSSWAAVRLWSTRGWLLAIAGTPLLFVAGRTLWPETVGVVALLAVLLIERRRGAWCAAVPFLVLAVTLCRLPFGVLLLGVVIVLWWRSEGFLAWSAGLGFAAGVLVLVAYSWDVFGKLSPAGAYPVGDRLQWAQLVAGVVSPARGILWWSPWLAFVRLRRDRQSYVWLLCAGYVLGVIALYGSFGGSGFAGYRYALPLAVASVPLVRLPALFGWAAFAWSAGLAVYVEFMVPLSPATRGFLSAGLPHDWLVWPIAAMWAPTLWYFRRGFFAAPRAVEEAPCSVLSVG